MIRAPGLVAAGALALAGCAWFPTASPTDALASKIDAWMARFHVDRAALVANRCGQPWLEIREDAPPGRGFELASSSKWVTATAILAASDRGIVDLDLPLSTWLPELGDRREATLRQVLGHSAGYVGIHPCIGDPGWTLQDCARAVDTQLGAAPGTQFRYANTGLVVAAAAVERAAGRPYEEVFDEVLVQPMGWRATGFGVLSSPGNPNPAYGVRSTAEEYLQLGQMVLDGGMGPRGRVLRPETVEAMWTGELLGRSGFVPPNLRGVPYPIYGLGVWLEEHDADGRPTVASAQGRYGFQPWIDRRRGIAAVFAVELGGPGAPDGRSSPASVKDAVAELADALPPCDAP